MINKDSEWIRASTAAKIKGVTRQAIYYSINEGKLKTLEIDGNIFVDKDEVQELKIRERNAKRKTDEPAAPRIAPGEPLPTVFI